jgi:hypothetical protein
MQPRKRDEDDQGSTANHDSQTGYLLLCTMHASQGPETLDAAVERGKAKFPDVPCFFGRLPSAAWAFRLLLL